VVERADLARSDAADPLASLRDRVELPPDVVYLDGNSLGPLCVGVAARVRLAVEHGWGEGLIRSWNDAGWADLPRRAAERIAPLIGADADEVAVTDSTSADLFRLLVAMARLRPDRRVLLTDDRNFPTDRYVAGGVADLLGLEVRVVPAGDLADALDPSVAVVTATEVDYRTGVRHDLATLTGAAHDVGALTVWDLSHSTGAVHVDLQAIDADAAVGCTYKYLNGGPGAPAYLHVARRHHAEVSTPVRGWFGHAEPFAFSDAYAPAPGPRGSTPGPRRCCHWSRWTRPWTRGTGSTCAPWPRVDVSSPTCSSASSTGGSAGSASRSPRPVTRPSAGRRCRSRTPRRTGSCVP
jgi:kynureninase